jgi:hypothetical protein
MKIAWLTNLCFLARQLRSAPTSPSTGSIGPYAISSASERVYFLLPPFLARKKQTSGIVIFVHREWAKVEEDSRRALALDYTLVKVAFLFLLSSQN